MLFYDKVRPSPPPRLLAPFIYPTVPVLWTHPSALCTRPPDDSFSCWNRTCVSSLDRCRDEAISPLLVRSFQMPVRRVCRVTTSGCAPTSCVICPTNAHGRPPSRTALSDVALAFPCESPSVPMHHVASLHHCPTLVMCPPPPRQVPRLHLRHVTPGVRRVQQRIVGVHPGFLSCVPRACVHSPGHPHCHVSSINTVQLLGRHLPHHPLHCP